MDRDMDRTHNAGRGFTLIELLVVVSIIGLLAAIIVPSIMKAFDSAKRVKALAQIQDLEGAVKQYFKEYGKMPVPGTGYNGVEAKEATPLKGVEQARVVEILINSSLNTNANPRQIVFLDLDPASFGTNTLVGMQALLRAGTPYRDPWWKAGETVGDYGILMDLNFDGVIRGTPYGDLRATVAVYSSGEKRDEADPPYRTW